MTGTTNKIVNMNEASRREKWMTRVRRGLLGEMNLLRAGIYEGEIMTTRAQDTNEDK